MSMPAPEPALFRRTTWICADAEHMADFYAAVFGMKRWYDQTLAVDARFPPTGAPDQAPARLIMLQATHPELGMIGFLSYIGGLPGASATMAPADGQLRPGQTVKVFNCTDVEALHQRAVSAGAIISSPPAEWSVPAREGGGVTRLKMLCFFDPEGGYCEVSQRV
ncbi:VOC family protein [Rhabdaerophilum sp.]|uniref:VOC family protein n=1 Tax=Rhabdaerophilum sp. TaxID=2717341 RepID=UPI0038D400D9